MFSAVAAFALPASTLLTGPLIARALGPADRGALAAVLAPLLLLPAVLGVGLKEATLFHVASGRASPKSVAQAATVLSLLYSLIAVAVVWVTAPAFLRQFPDLVGLLRGLALALPVVFVVNSLRAVAQGESQFGVVNGERWIVVLLRVALLVGAVGLGVLGVTGAALISFVGTVVALPLFLPMLAGGDAARRGFFADAARSSPAAPASGPMLRGRPLAAALTRYGARTWVGSSGGFLATRLDLPVLAVTTSATGLGVYAVAVAVAEVPRTGLGLVNDVVFSTATSRGEPALIARAARGLAVASIGMTLVAAAVLPFAVPLLFGSDFSAAALLAVVLLLGGVPGSIAQVLGVGLLGLGRPGAWSTATAINVVVSLALLVVLSLAFGLTGAAVATLSARAFAAVSLARLFSRASGVPLLDCLVPRPRDALDLGARLRGVLRERRRPAPA